MSELGRDYEYFGKHDSNILPNLSGDVLVSSTSKHADLLLTIYLLNRFEET